MLKLFIALFLPSSFLFLTGCCNKVECATNGGHFQIRLMRDGKNAVYGPDAFVYKDSIQVYQENNPLVENYIFFIDTFQAVYLSIEEHFPIVLKFNSTLQDTFSVTTEVTDDNGCCPTIEVTSLMRNGQAICTQDCEDVVFDVEI